MLLMQLFCTQQSTHHKKMLKMIFPRLTSIIALNSGTFIMKYTVCNKCIIR